MAISEKIELLGKGLYTDIPDELTLKAIPTASELEYVGSEDFESVMLDSILPQAIEEKIDCRKLLAIDFEWVCRCLRILNYGPYHTTNMIYCDKCRKTTPGEFSVNLETIACKPLPADFTNDLVVSKDEFIDFDGDIHMKLPTVLDMHNAFKDKAFQLKDGRVNRELARLCYMITSIKNKKNLTPFDVKMNITQNLSSADYKILIAKMNELSDYGLRAAGTCTCPSCGNKEAAFIALVNDKFFRPTLGDLRNWKHSRSQGGNKDVS